MDGRLPLSRIIAAGVVVILLATGFVYAGKRIPGWAREFSKPPPPLEVFIEDCRRRIPEDAPIFLVTDDNPLRTATRLYPRPIRVVSLDEARRESRTVAGAWVVRTTDPFDEKASFAVPAHDLP